MCYYFSKPYKIILIQIINILIEKNGWWFYGLWCLRHFQQYFIYIVGVIFIGEENRSTRRKPPTYRKLLTNFITYCCIEYTSPLPEFEFRNLGDRHWLHR